MGQEGERGPSAEEMRRLGERVVELERRLAAYKGSPEASLPGSALGVTQEEREELLVEAERLAQIGSWFWNVETSEVYWSPGLYRVFGRDPATTPASLEAFAAAVHPDDRRAMQAAIERATGEDSAVEQTFRVARPDGSVRHVAGGGARLYDEAGRLRRIVGACVDVTARREAELGMERALVDLGEAQAVANVGSWVLDASSGAVRWSAQLRQILDVDADLEPSMFELFEHVALEDRARLVDVHERILAGASDGETEVDVRTRRGPRVVKVREVAERDATGRLRTARGTITDVTEARSIAAQAAHGQKMEAIGRLAGGVAHDLNNHLMVIQGNLHLLALPASEARSALLGAVEAARQTASRLLAFGRKSTLRRARVDVNELVRHSVLLLGPVVAADATLETVLAPDLPPIDADASLVGQCIVNLVLNARDAIRTGGRIEVRTGLATEPGLVVVEVRDDGDGMDAETRSRAFEPFFTTKPVGMGSGLGLSMVQGTLEQHGGAVELESARGRGTRVTTKWPVATDAPATRTTAARSGSPARRTILVVEDQPALGRLMQQLLEGEGHRVLLATTPSRALALAAQYRDEVDLVLSDVVMPEMRGPALVTALEPQLGSPPAVIFMSGYPPEDLGLRAEALLLRKPFTLEALRAAIDRTLSERPRGGRSG